MNETTEQNRQRLTDRIRGFGEVLSELKGVVYDNEPFIPETLYRELFDNLLMAAQAEDISISVHRPEEPDWYQNGRENLDAFLQSATTVSKIIRTRIETLAVPPG